jgi:hypothetical protein
MVVFLAEAEKTPPNPEWEAKIEAVSSKFKELKQKAVEKTRSMRGTAAADAPEAPAEPAPTPAPLPPPAEAPPAPASPPADSATPPAPPA